MFGSVDISEEIFNEPFTIDGITVDGKIHPDDPFQFSIRVTFDPVLDGRLYIAASNYTLFYISSGEIIAKIRANSWTSVFIGIEGK